MYSEGIITHRGLLEESGEEQGWWQGGIIWGEMPGIGDGGMEAANHLAKYVPMQQSSILHDLHMYPRT